ncbi:hypothetical protein V5O48_010231 [Marasmius crinis-equi]|uniref:Uncharacterized protein n=1 Tax=Marasmius crinis-equi TaxID=585013 RepID=A0ABR3F8V5_9AGAR
MPVFPANAGIMIEGLAVLGSAPNVPNQDANAIFSSLIEIVNNTVSNKAWYNLDGILVADDLTRQFAELGDQYIVRDLCPVKYNAVMSNARGQGKDNNIYGAPWTGAQQPLSFSLTYQTNALSILISSINIQNDTPATPGDPQPTASTAKNRLNVGAIAGGVVGGLAAVAFLTILALWLIRRRSSATQILNAKPLRSENVVRVRMNSHANPAPEKSGYRGEKRSSTAPRDLERAEDMSSTDLDYTDTDISSSQSPFGLDGEISTADLVMLLNHRLHGGWREDEPPPDYASQGPPSNPHRSLE